MLLEPNAIKQFLTENYPDVTSRVLDPDHLAADCPKCKRGVALQVSQIETHRGQTRVGASFVSLFYPFFVLLKCPICSSVAVWVLYRTGEKSTIPSAADLLRVPIHEPEKIYRIASIPPEGLQEILDLPEKPATLRTAYIEAIRSLDNNCPMAAAAMFRRALQVITRDILGATPGTLASELKSLVGKENKLGLRLSKSFDNHSYILKEVGNQAAHPDRNPDLLSFTYEDAMDLHAIFLELISELFVAPAASARAVESLMQRRRIVQPPARKSSPSEE